ncbi:hypothetical protein GLAREA_10498 [Glarea lozoyensis ATCC 20868]|uniref:Uncharacterized protein n=1 Tax=Glarea lozoyensis (strain ATCC 20868 / MF5171) TaxID=1116229 RepID=S3E968_GLAL2|nr:uncharacterized protein GLAREA_10498 [Glarea lozoyensis ATCC 20868]EPE34803.1 hypothetical protein GLAREA_10498 [Glarea lozoyensis ATCC 20868]
MSKPVPEKSLCDFLIKRDPLSTSKLKVRLDFPMATLPLLRENGMPDSAYISAPCYMWSSHITFPNSVGVISDAQLWQIALEAGREMEDEFEQYEMMNRNKKLPGAMTVLAFDREIIVASSQKGRFSFVYDCSDTPVKRDLKRCRKIVWQRSARKSAKKSTKKSARKNAKKNARKGARQSARKGGRKSGKKIGKDFRHIHDGKCGEEMAMHLYYMKHGLNLSKLENARIGTVKLKPNGEHSHIDPCSVDKEKAKDKFKGKVNEGFGCKEFTDLLGLTVLEKDTLGQAYNFATLFPTGSPTIDHIESLRNISN